MCPCSFCLTRRFVVWKPPPSPHKSDSNHLVEKKKDNPASATPGRARYRYLPTLQTPGFNAVGVIAVPTGWSTTWTEYLFVEQSVQTDLVEDCCSYIDPEKRAASECANDLAMRLLVTGSQLCDGGFNPMRFHLVTIVSSCIVMCILHPHQTSSREICRRLDAVMSQQTMGISSTYRHRVCHCPAMADRKLSRTAALTGCESSGLDRVVAAAAGAIILAR